MRMLKGRIFDLAPFESFERGEPVAVLEDTHEVTQATLTLEGFKKGDLIELECDTVEAPTVQGLQMLAVKYVINVLGLGEDDVTVGDWERMNAIEGDEHYFLPMMVKEGEYMVYTKLVVEN